MKTKWKQILFIAYRKSESYMIITQNYIFKKILKISNEKSYRNSHKKLIYLKI